MRRAIDYVLRRKDRQDEHGYFGNRDGRCAKVYGHGIITLTLSPFEMLGMGPIIIRRRTGPKDSQEHPKGDKLDHCVRKRCPKALSHQGGWRYSPDAFLPGNNKRTVTPMPFTNPCHHLATDVTAFGKKRRT